MKKSYLINVVLAAATITFILLANCAMLCDGRPQFGTRNLMVELAESGEDNQEAIYTGRGVRNLEEESFRSGEVIDDNLRFNDHNYIFVPFVSVRKYYVQRKTIQGEIHIQ